MKTILITSLLVVFSFGILSLGGIFGYEAPMVTDEVDMFGFIHKDGHDFMGFKKED